jgi:hypothetical protein
MSKRFLLPLLFFAQSLAATNASTLDSLLIVLEDEVSHADAYTARHQKYIDSLCTLRPMTQELQLRIAEEYQHFQSDSSLAWFLKLQDAEEPIRTKAFVEVVQLLGSSGHYNSAIAMLDKPNAPSIRGVDGYKMAWLLYSDAAADAHIPMFVEDLRAKTQLYYDSMMMALEQDTVYSQESRCWYNLYRASDQNDWATALRYSEQLLAMTTPEEHLYAILAYGHAMIYENAGDQTKRREWLVRSAITDVRCGITDNGSSWLVAQDCLDAGDFERAYRLSDYSFTNATFFNAPTRFIQIFTPGHLIVRRYEHQLRQSFIRQTIALLLFAVALVAMIFAVVYAYRQNRRLHSLNHKIQAMNDELRSTNRLLKDANHVKEQYIYRYMEVYSDYIRRLTTMARKAGEKDPTSFMNHEMENFYRSFDDTFLSLYGTFVQDFNALLKPEARLIPKPGERMTIEMRIFALILLGIDSSAKIADLLCYSPNTISNYRVKIKNSALGDRDNFENQVRNIRTLY